MNDLRAIIGVNYLAIFHVPMAIYAGYLIGPFVPLAYRWLNRQLVLVAATSLSAIVMAVVPISGSITILYGLMALHGIGSGAWVGSCNSWLKELNPSIIPAVLHISYVVFGLGTMLAPMVSMP